MVTLAHRHGVGNLVWMCWEGVRRRTEGKSGNYCRPQCGTQLIAISCRGARILQANWDALAHGRFDLVLKKALYCNAEFLEKVGTSYIWPSVGHYVNHESSVMMNPIPRVAAWDEW